MSLFIRIKDCVCAPIMKLRSCFFCCRHTSEENTKWRIFELTGLLLLSAMPAVLLSPFFADELNNYINYYEIATIDANAVPTNFTLCLPSISTVRTPLSGHPFKDIRVNVEYGDIVCNSLIYSVCYPDNPEIVDCNYELNQIRDCLCCQKQGWFNPQLIGFNEDTCDGIFFNTQVLYRKIHAISFLVIIPIWITIATIIQLIGYYSCKRDRRYCTNQSSCTFLLCGGTRDRKCCDCYNSEYGRIDHTAETELPTV